MPVSDQRLNFIEVPVIDSRYERDILMLNVNSDKSNDGLLTAYSSQNNRAGSPSRGTDSSPKRHLGDSDSSGVSIGETPLITSLSFICFRSDASQAGRTGGKGMFLWRMKKPV